MTCDVAVVRVKQVCQTLQLPEVYGAIRKLVPMTTETGVDGKLYIGTVCDVILEGSLHGKIKTVVQVSADVFRAELKEKQEKKE